MSTHNNFDLKAGLRPAVADTSTHGPAAIISLLAKLADCSGDGIAQKRQLIEGLARLIRADAWSWTLTRTEFTGDPASAPAIVLRIDHGLSEAQRSILLRTQNSPHRRILSEAIYQRFDANGGCTCRRDEVLPDPQWLTSGYYAEFVTAMDLNEFLLATRHIRQHDVSTTMFYRKLGEPPFTAADVELIDLAVDNVEWYHRHGDVSVVAPSIIDLTPRERQVLQLTVGGDGRKQIAAKLGISQHTVGDYQKTIYRLFGVASRGELAAKFLAGHQRLADS